MELNAELFVAVGFVLFLALLGYLGVHKTITAALDGRIASISSELEEARRMRAEAKALLAAYQAKLVEAEAQAAAIVEQARKEAELLASETSQRMVDFVERHRKQAEAQILMAESQATSEVRASAVEAALKAAEIVLRAQATGAGGDAFIVKGIDDVKRLMN
jgi:F-type H+-transporting ATPase subunit b